MHPLKSITCFLLAALLAACNPLSQPEQVASAVVGNSTAIVGITERAALDLLLVALEQHHVADLDCLQFRSENNITAGSKAVVWEFAAIEVHNATCGGDPSIAHVRDRYKISLNGSIMVYDPVNADYIPLL